MNAKIIKALIKGVVAIVVAVIGIFVGMKFEQRNIQTQIKDVMGDVINVNGNYNNVAINNVETLVENYIQLQSDYDALNQQKDSLVIQNTEYFDDLSEANDKIKKLESGNNQEIVDLKAQLDSVPNIDYKNLALCIEIDDIPINSNNSMVTIDGRDYFSREIVENLIPENKNLTIKDGTIFIGTVAVEKVNLLSQTVFEHDGIYKLDAGTDSYGNNYSNVLYADTSNKYVSLYTKYITYYLDGKYSYLKFSAAVRDNVNADSTGILTIKADDNVIYTSESLNKRTKFFTVSDLPINNCDFLTIEYIPNDYYIDCIISDTIIYN